MRVAPREPETWAFESDGPTGNILRTLPDRTAVIYVFCKPVWDHSLNIRRYRWMDLSMYDAIRCGVFGYSSMPPEAQQAALTAEHQSLIGIDGIVALSTCAADAISRAFAYPRDKITPVGAGPTFYVSDRNLFRRSRYEAGRVLFVGRDWSRKGGPLLLEAMAIVRQRAPHATLHVVGPPTCPAELPWLVYHQPINKATRRGLLALKRLFTASSVFSMPTLCEPWGLVFSEAAECGLPIVGFQEWSLPDIVEDGVTGLLVAKRDPYSLAEALVRVLADPIEGLRMGMAARHRCREILDWRHVVSRLLNGIHKGAEGTSRDAAVRPLRMAVGLDRGVGVSH